VPKSRQKYSIAYWLPAKNPTIHNHISTYKP